MKLLRILILALVGFSPLQAKEKYTLSICSLFHNEERFLKEWIEYHLMVGVEHFYLFNHLNEDNWEKVLEPYIEEGIVEVYDWHYPFEENLEWIRQIQSGAYNAIIETKKEESKWIAFVDTDEFIVPKQGDDVRTILEEFEDHAALFVNWQMYGTSSVQRIPEDQTMIGTLLKRAPVDHQENLFVKSIVRPKTVDYYDDAHHPHFLEGYQGVTESGNSIGWQRSESVHVDKICLNHYIYRDEEFYWKEKLPRHRKLYPWIKEGTPPKEIFSSVEDTSMLRFVPELERRLFETK